MSPLVAFILGLLVGLLIEWIIDWVYWRKRLKALQLELDQTSAKLAAKDSQKSNNLEMQMAAMADLNSLQEKNTGLETDNAALNQQIAALKMEKSALVEQLAGCQGKLSAAESAQAIEKPQAQAAPVSTGAGTPTVRLAKAAAVQPDDLEIIKGIGPVINRKLNQGGIYTFEQLAALTPARLVEIVGDVIQRLADEDAIINQAKELAARKGGGG
jgi:predicted flap endonuclease-1-like 5' DNA nuclease